MFGDDYLYIHGYYLNEHDIAGVDTNEGRVLFRGGVTWLMSVEKAKDIADALERKRKERRAQILNADELPIGALRRRPGGGH